jgi:RNA polymerase sigma-70 factor (ECF subfamily)
LFFLFDTLVGSGEPLEDVAEAEVQELVRAARAGDAGAASRLYGVMVVPVYRATRPLCSSDADAEDVVQEAFVKAFAALDRYVPRPGTRFLGWLLTIALNDARKQVARDRRRRRIVTSEGETRREEHGPTPERDVLERQQKQRLLSALAELSERDRQIVSLRYGAGLEADEVAALCETSAANVRKVCERQRKRLLTLLSEPSAPHDAPNPEPGDD